MYRRMSSLVVLATVVFPERTVVQAEDLRIYRILGGTPGERREFVDESLGGILGLPPSRREPLLRTLEELYAAGGRVEAAAKALHIHPKTVGYRTSRIEELTGLGLHTPAERLRLDLAVHLLRLSRGTGREAPFSPPDREL
jgi:DNA-binding PucR family transcriptional regulator